MQVKQAYYSLSLEYHPDQQQGNPEKFRAISEAYEILSNVKKRTLYDKGFYNPRVAATSEEADSFAKAVHIKK